MNLSFFVVNKSFESLKKCKDKKFHDCIVSETKTRNRFESMMYNKERDHSWE